jgi:hypothetical protein
MTDLKSKAKEKIDDAADAAKKTAANAIDKSKDLVHAAGKKIEKGGRTLKNI